MLIVALLSFFFNFNKTTLTYFSALINWRLVQPMHRDLALVSISENKLAIFCHLLPQSSQIAENELLITHLVKVHYSSPFGVAGVANLNLDP